MSNRQFVERELKENPEFFKAFPHLQQVFDESKDEGLNSGNNYLGSDKRYLHNKIVNFSNLEKDPGFFDGLLHQQNNFQPKETDSEDIIRQNEKNFVEASSASMEGPFKYLSKARIDEIHLEIDDRMQELEDTGLTRNEILFDDALEGIALRDDPFYQLIKGNKTAREMLIGANEEFSADRVLEKALRQDIGVDASLSGVESNFQFKDEWDALAPTWEYRKKYRDTTPLVKADSYFAGGNIVDKQNKQLDYEMEKPATFLNRPMTRGQIRKRYMRTISKKDIEWKNTPFLCKFLNETGKIYNRYQSRLPTSTHRKVAKTVKKMRNLGILPYTGLLMPTDKIPVGSYIQDIEELHKKTIDPITGRMFMKHTLQDDLRDKRVREKAMVENKAKNITTLAEEKANELEENVRSQMVREMSIDASFAENPTPLLREWAIAQGHLIETTIMSEKDRDEKRKDPYFEPMQYEVAENMYTKVMGKIGGRQSATDSQMGKNLFEDLLIEKSMDYEKLTAAKPVTHAQKSLN